MRKLLFILVILLFYPSLLFAQVDPGVPDTVKFGEWKACVPCPPCSGIAVVPVEFFNDEGIAAFTVSLKHTEILDADTAFLVPEWSQITSIWRFYVGDSITNTSFDYKNKILMSAVSFSESIPPSPESKPIFYLHFLVKDTGFVSLDTVVWYTFSDSWTVRFSLPSAVQFIPQSVKTEFHITPTPFGDANLDGEVNLGDAIFLARYVFGKETPPFDVCMHYVDMNGDEKIDLSDVILLAKYILGQ